MAALDIGAAQFPLYQWNGRKLYPVGDYGVGNRMADSMDCPKKRRFLEEKGECDAICEPGDNGNRLFGDAYGPWQ